MNEIWQNRLKKSQERIRKKRQRSVYKEKFIKAGIVLLLLHLMFPQYLRRVVYPYLYGKPTENKLVISTADDFKDVTAPPFAYKRGSINYQLYPRTKYAVTGRVGTVEDYSTLRNKIFRGQFQGKYINLVPRDLFLVIGNMAQPEIFKLFKFPHEERMGSVECKGVKYGGTLIPKMMSEKEYRQNEEKYQKCNRHINDAEQNNYHPIPANERINKALSMLLPGDVVYLEGILVDVPAMGLNTGTRKLQTHKNLAIGGWKPGMCFILYTTKIQLKDRIYE